MAEGSPASRSFETWAERLIREAQERGEFDDLPGRGRPLRGVDGPPDELWWVRAYVEREGLSLVPPALALRREVEDLPARLGGERSEARVREVLEDVNDRIRRMNRLPTEGPPSTLMPLDVEAWVERWRHMRP